MLVTVSLNAAAMIERTPAAVALQQVNFGIEHICVDGRFICEPDKGIFHRGKRFYEASQKTPVPRKNAGESLAEQGAGFVSGSNENIWARG